MFPPYDAQELVGGQRECVVAAAAPLAGALRLCRGLCMDSATIQPADLLPLTIENMAEYTKAGRLLDLAAVNVQCMQSVSVTYINRSVILVRAPLAQEIVNACETLLPQSAAQGASVMAQQQLASIFTFVTQVHVLAEARPNVHATAVLEIYCTCNMRHTAGRCDDCLLNCCYTLAVLVQPQKRRGTSGASASDPRHTRGQPCHIWRRACVRLDANPGALIGLLS